MKTIVAGSRDFAEYDLLALHLDQSPWRITEVVSGKARGADSLGEEWAAHNDIPVSSFPADWNKYGKSAGYIRNSAMADEAGALVAFWDGKSKGTKHMIDLALGKRLYVYVVPV